MTATKPSIFKRGLSALLAVTTMLSSGVVGAFADTDDAVNITDENLRKAICTALNKSYSEGVTITEGEMASLTELKAENAGIKDLTGIEKAVNLAVLDLSGNPIDDDSRESARGYGKSFEKLESLTKIKKLDLSNCKIGENSSGSTYDKLIIPGTPDSLWESLQAMTDIEEIDLSSNNIAGSANFYIGLQGFNKLKKLNLSHNRLNVVSGLQERYLNTIEEINLDDNYIFWDERDGNWHQGLMNSTSIKTSHDNQKNLADLYAVYYVSNGVTGNSYESFLPALVDETTKTIDLGTLCGGTLTIAPACFASANSIKVTIDGDTKVTASSVFDLSSIIESSCQYTMTNLKSGDYSIKLDVMHMGEDKTSYTLKFKMTDLPVSDSEDSAGIKDINLQYQICKKLKIENEVSTHIVTKDEMKSLTSLTVSDLTSAEGIQYATNLTSLSISGSFDEVPDISGMTKLKNLTVASTNLKNVIDVSNFTNLTRLTVSSTVDNKLPDVSALTKLTGIVIRDCDADVEVPGIENCTKLTTYTLMGCGGTHTFPLNVVPAKGKMTYTISQPVENSKFDFSNVKNNTNVTNLSIGYSDYNEIPNVTITGIDKDTTSLTSFSVTGAKKSLIPDDLGYAPNLTKLSVKGPIDSLPDSILSATNLTNFTIADALKLPAIVGKLSTVTSLSINNIAEIDSEYDFSGLTGITELEITNSGLTKVPSADKLPTNITSLTLRTCKISEMDTNGYDKLENLTSVDLSYNNFTSYPMGLSTMPNLTSINLMLNYIGYIPKNAFDKNEKLSTLMIGSLLPLQNDENGNQVVDERYSDTKTAIEKAEEITAKNGGMVMAETYKAMFYGVSYALLASLDSDKGTIESCFGENTEAFKVLGNGVTSITLKPVTILPDTTITYNGKKYNSGDEIIVNDLKDGTNEIKLTAETTFSNFANVPKSVEYTIKLFCGQTISADELEEGHTYRVDYKLYKSGLTVESMSAGYFDSYAVVRYKNGKYEVRLKTNKSSYISDMDYYNGDNREDAQVIEKDLTADTATYRVYANNLTDRLVISPYVVPMGYYPKCDVVFDTQNIVDISDQMPSVDFDELNITINEALALTEKNNIYTDDSYSAFTKALEAAQKVAAEPLSSQEEIDAAEQALSDAMDALVIDENKLADKTALQTALETAKAVEKGKHTETAWNALQEAIADAQSVYDDIYATQAEVKAATKALNTAVTLFNASGDASQLDKNNLKDGTYSVYGEMIKVSRDEKSMSNDAINHYIKLTVEDGKYYLTMDFHGLAYLNKFGYLAKLSYYDNGYSYGEYGAVDGTLIQADVLSTQKNKDGSDLYDEFNEKGGSFEGNLYPDIIKFPLVSDALADEEGYIPLHVFVPVMEDITPGTGDQDVLLKLDWSTLTMTTDDDPNFEPEKPEEQSPEVNFTDAVTGVTVHADKGVLPEGAYITVTAVTSGSAYDNAVAVLGDDAKNAKLYEVKFFDKDGNEVKPNGTVSITFPSDDENTTVYRISDDSKVLVKGTFADHAYTVITKTGGIYAEVLTTAVDPEEPVTPGDSDNPATPDNPINPGTGVAIGFASVVPMLCAGAAMIATKKRRNKKGE